MLKRLICMVAACTLLCACMSVGASAAEKNMFKNGNFARNMNNWQSWSNDPANCTVEYTKDSGVDGSGAALMTNQAPAANSVFQYASMKYGKTYIMQADVKYENVSPDGAGVVLGMTMYDAAANNIGEMTSSSHYGTSDGWITLSFVFTITNENAVTVNAGPRLWFSTGKVWVDNVSVYEMVNIGAQAQPGTYELTVSDTPNAFKTLGLGCEWDPKLLLPVNRERGITDEDLDLIKTRMQEMGLQSVRMMVMPEWFEPVNDDGDPHSADFSNFRWDSEEGKCTLEYLRVCHELGVDVNLTWWGAAAGDWLSYPDCGDWISAPNDLDEMAENIVTVLRYVKEQKGYDCVKGVILQNEPSYSFKVSGGVVDFDRYVQYYKTVDAYLKDAGLREGVKLIGADDAQSLGWYCRAYDALKDTCDAFDSHTYSWSYDMSYLDDMIDEFVHGRTDYSTEKPFFFGEFGDGSAQGAYAAASTETYGRGLFVASMAVNSLGAGAAGLSYWPLHDVYYYYNETGGDNYGLMSMGLIGYKTDGQWSYRPTYYAWGLLCNYIPKGSEIYPVTGEDGNLIDAVCAKAPDGTWSLIAVNRSAAEQVVKVSTSLFDCEMDTYLFEEGKLPTDGSQIASDGKIGAQDGVYTITLPAYSFRVLNGKSDASDIPEDTSGAEQESAEGSVQEQTTVQEQTGEQQAGGCKSAFAGAAGALLTAAAAAIALGKKTRK
ncbi:MAG: carbohydrate binding domain-containing protein [Clostridia bacterium]|nr:carbohydrate binding domain-containing protein [Clostridia bacterium]